MARKTKPRPGAPRGNSNAEKPPAERGEVVSIRLTPEMIAALAEIGGPTAGVRALIQTACGAVPGQPRSALMAVRLPAALAWLTQLADEQRRALFGATHSD